VDITSGAALLYPILYFFDASGWFAAVLPAVICHELGHWAALRICGAKVRRIRLEVSGLCMETAPLPFVWQEAFCAAAGPAAGLLWILPALWIGGSWGCKSASAALWINLFNLLPALPLDGGRILLAVTGSESALRIGALTCFLALLALFIGSRRPVALFPALFLLWSAVRQE